MVDALTPLADFLTNLYNNPLAFMIVVFVYAIAVAVILPIPIEAALLLPLADQRWGYIAGITISLAAGKTVGAWLVFVLGLHVEGPIRSWSTRWRFAAWFVSKAEKFVAKTGITGLYILLSIPLMSDTIPIYLYSLFNPEGSRLDQNMYLVANFLAALNRVAILVVFFLIGVSLI